jgi:hypothetical protein
MKKEAKKPEEVWRVVEVPIWDARLFIYYGPWDSFIDRLAEAGFEPENILSNKPKDWNVATTYSRKDGANVVYSAKPLSPHALVHELVHVTNGIMRAKRVADEESFAYTMEWLFMVTEATK